MNTHPRVDGGKTIIAPRGPRLANLLIARCDRPECQAGSVPAVPKSKSVPDAPQAARRAWARRGLQRSGKVILPTHRLQYEKDLEGRYQALASVGAPISLGFV